MKNAQFNFHYEDTLIDIIINDDDTVTVLGTTFDDIQSFAEKFAVQRGVPSDSLKSWHIIRQGDIYNYVPKAATAGNGDDIDKVQRVLSQFDVDASSINAVIAKLSGQPVAQPVAQPVGLPVAQPFAQPFEETNSVEDDITRLMRHIPDDMFDGRIKAAIDFLQSYELQEIIDDAKKYYGEDDYDYDDGDDDDDDDYDYGYDDGDDDDDDYDLAHNVADTAYQTVVERLKDEYPGIPTDISLALQKPNAAHPWLKSVTSNDIKQAMALAQLTNRPALVFARALNGSIEPRTLQKHERNLKSTQNGQLISFD